jgi:hypothetical protein
MPRGAPGVIRPPVTSSVSGTPVRIETINGKFWKGGEVPRANRIGTEEADSLERRYNTY